MKRIGGYSYPLLSAEQVAPPASMISGIDTTAFGGIYTLDEHARNVGWCRGMSEYTEPFNSLDPAWNTSNLLSAVITSGQLVTQAKTDSFTLNYDSGAILNIPPIYGDFETSISLTFSENGSSSLCRCLFSLLDPDGNFIVEGGIRDGWAANSGYYVARTIVNYYDSGGRDTAPTSGTMSIKITRVSGVLSVYLNDVLRVSETDHYTQIKKIALINARLTTYNGYKATWDNLYLKRGR